MQCFVIIIVSCMAQGVIAAVDNKVALCLMCVRSFLRALVWLLLLLLLFLRRCCFCCCFYVVVASAVVFT